MEISFARMLRDDHPAEQMKSPTNPVIYWKIKELAVTARCSVGELLREAGVSTSTVHAWTHGGVTPSPRIIAKINQASERLRRRSAA